MQEEFENAGFDDRPDSWAAEFAGSPEAAAFTPREREQSAPILSAFLRGASSLGVELTQIGEREVKAGLLDYVARLDLPPDLRGAVPEIIAAFVVMLGRQGRLARGALLAAQVRAHAREFLAAVPGAAGGAPRGTPLRREYSKLGLNDPCPCGSGKKWKKCCRQLFDTS